MAKGKEAVYIMRNVLFKILTVITVFSFTAVSYAGSVFAGELELTGGLDFDKEKCSTFNSSKTISGTADEGTVIEITVYKRVSDDKLKEMDYYVVEVGESGLFSQTVDLYVGENVVSFYAETSEDDSVEMEATVTRKKKEIKSRLENEIYLPGQTAAD